MNKEYTDSSRQITIVKALSFLAVLFLLSSCTTDEPVLRQEKIYKEINGTELRVYVFSTAGSRRKTDNPAIAFFHGGGWVFGSPDEFFGACERYALKGFITFSFQYRLSINDDGSYPNPGITPIESVKDARSAIRWIRKNAGSLGVNPDKIVVGGQSAGGQLALSTALLDGINEDTDDLQISPGPDALLLYSSNVNTMEAWVDMLLGKKRDRIWAISPYHNLKKNMPPAIGFRGEEDCTVLPYIVDMFKKRMDELGNEFELISYPGRKHYLGEGNKKYANYFDEEILERTDEFLRRHGFM